MHNSAEGCVVMRPPPRAVMIILTLRMIDQRGSPAASRPLTPEEGGPLILTKLNPWALYQNVLKHYCQHLQAPILLPLFIMLSLEFKR